jgi:opacity protein-like surface antigen
MKKLMLLLFFSFVLTTIVQAQNWGGGIDDERFNWGFSFQSITSEYKITKKSNWREPFYDPGIGNYVTDSLASISSPTSQGFGIGFVVNGNVNANVDLRFTPTLVFNDRIINYTYIENKTYNPSTSLIQKKIQATMVDLPLSVKLKSDRLMNFRAYMLGGLKYSVDLASGKKNNDLNVAPIDKLLKNNRSFLSYEAGIGFDIYFEYFKMSPEVKLSYSFKDVMKHDISPYDNPIEQAKLRHFTFSLFFE